MKNQISILKILNLFALIAMVAINALAQSLPIGGLNTQQISALYPTLITPAGITFMIWIVIYLLLALFVGEQFFTKDDKATRKIGILFALSCGLNIAWIFFWHYQLMLFATISIILLWICLYMISKSTDGENWMVKTGFSIYYAWITVASIIQLFIYFAKVFPGLHVRLVAVLISVAVLLALLIISLYRLIKKGDFLYGITMAWSMLGIFISHMGSGYNKMYPILCVITGVGMTAIIVTCILCLKRCSKCCDSIK